LKKYELNCVIKTTLDMDAVELVLKNIEDTIKTYGGIISNIDKTGRRKLAYDIQGFRDGYYVLFAIELEQVKIADLKRYLKLNENVLRAMITIQQKTPVAK